MSTQEKSLHLKECLKTIGIGSPELSRFIKRSVELEKNSKQLVRKREELSRRLDRIEAELFLILTS
jgi:tRNA threonylcarbamoyladenosine modification (KEOPS) complex  Pcc1 subunit